MTNDPEILRQETLTDLCEKFKSPGSLIKNSGILPVKRTTEKSIQWDEHTDKQDIGAFVGDDDTANLNDDEILGNRSAKLLTSFDEARIDGDMLMQLRRPGSDAERMTIEDQIAGKILRLSQIHERQDEFLVSQALQGSIATKIKRVSHTIDYAQNAANHFKIGGGGGNGNLPVSWGNAAAKVFADLDNIRKVVRDATGYELTRMLIGPGVKEAIFHVDEAKEFLESTPAGAEMVRTGQIAELYGFRISEYQHRYFDTLTSAYKYHIPAGKIILTPEPDAQWGDFVVGGVVVKNSSGQLVMVTGPGGWSKTEDNPPSGVVYRRYRRLPRMRNIRAIATAQVLPA